MKQPVIALLLLPLLLLLLLLLPRDRCALNLADRLSSSATVRPGCGESG